jgi:hypothetical protein
MRAYDETHQGSDAEEESSDLGLAQSASFFTPQNTPHQSKRSLTTTWLIPGEAPLNLMLIGTELGVLAKFANLVSFKGEQQSYLPVEDFDPLNSTTLQIPVSNYSVDINLTITKSDCYTRNLEYYSKHTIFLFCDPCHQDSLELIKRLISEIRQEYFKKTLPHLVLLIVKSNAELEPILLTKDINTLVSTNEIDQCHEIDLSDYEMLSTKFQNILDILFTEQEHLETPDSLRPQRRDNQQPTPSFCTLM